MLMIFAIKHKFFAILLLSLVGLQSQASIFIRWLDAENQSVLQKFKEPVPVTSLTFGTELMMMNVGAKLALTYTYAPDNADITGIKWTSDNPDVANVNETGLVNAISEGVCKITATYGNNQTQRCIVLVENSTGSSDGHDFVNLGLPSGTIWAMTNIGADSPEEEGLMLQTDIANAADSLWGVYWKTPSMLQFEELVNSDYTTTIQTSMNGVSGFLIVSQTNSKGIFLPSATYQGKGGAGSIADNGGKLTVRPVYKGIADSASIIVSSTDLNFGTVAVGSTKSLSFDIRNNTFVPQEIRAFRLDNKDFSIDWTGGELPPNTTQCVTVKYSPTSKTIATGGSLNIVSATDSSFVNVIASSHTGSPDLTTKKNLVVWGKDGSQTTFVLNEQPVVTISGGMVKVEAETAMTEFCFNDILKLTYEGLIETPSTLNDISSKKVFERTGDALTFFSDQEDLHVQIVSMSGIIVRQFTAMQGNVYNLPLGHLQTGAYVISVNKVSYKIVIR